MTTPGPATLPRLWIPAARGLWWLVAAAGLVVFLADQARLAQLPLAHCPSPKSGCSFSALVETDIRLIEQTGLSAPLVYSVMLALTAVARLSLPLAGALIFWRRRDDWVAWAFSLALMTVLAEGAADLGHLQVVVDLASGLGVLLWLPLPFIFPDGRLEPRWLRWPLGVIMVVGIVAWTPALGTRLLPSGVLVWLALATGLSWGGLAAYALVYRYRYLATPAERQQTKWVIAGFIVTIVSSTQYLLASALFPPWQPSGGRIAALVFTSAVYPIGYASFAAALALAVLRYRLWDIDLVIRRTLIYSTLTVLLALVYLGAVTIMQLVFHGLTGQTGSAAIIVSTLVSAALFQPLRRRLQATIDRRFYRRQYDASQTLATFAALARDSVDFNDLTARLKTVIDDALQPAHCSIWLRPPHGVRPTEALLKE